MVLVENKVPFVNQPFRKKNLSIYPHSYKGKLTEASVQYQVFQKNSYMMRIKVLYCKLSIVLCNWNKTNEIVFKIKEQKQKNSNDHVKALGKSSEVTTTVGDINCITIKLCII